MLSVRVIPTLLLRGNGLVKGVQFKNHKYVGDPVNAVKIFNDKEVDELVFLDITATNEGKGPRFDLLKEIASQAFMPFGYGGGLRTTGDIEKLFKLGVEKAIINSAAFSDKQFIKDAVSIAGSQSIVISIDVKKSFFGKYSVYTNSGTVDTKMDPVEYAKQVEGLGAGEIILCNIDQEGTQKGYDVSILNKVSSSVDIPVVASGGAGTMGDFTKAVQAGASAVAAGDMFVFYGKHKAVLITYPEQSKIAMLTNS